MRLPKHCTRAEAAHLVALMRMPHLEYADNTKEHKGHEHLGRACLMHTEQQAEQQTATAAATEWHLELVACSQPLMKYQSRHPSTEDREKVSH